MDVKEFGELVQRNATVFDSVFKADSVIKKHKKILCSVSGGKDSDIMLDLLWRLDDDKKIEYVWFNTGVEYQATKDHLDYLEDHYGIEIKRLPAIKSIPVSCREYGQPFISKFVSEHIHRLQIHGFKWEDKPYEELIKEYPKCKSSIKWWCNKYTSEGFKTSHFDINRNKYLKEFLIQNPPMFKIDKKCCDYAKKNVSHKYYKKGGFDCVCIGVRKAEGGALFQLQELLLVQQRKFRTTISSAVLVFERGRGILRRIIRYRKQPMLHGVRDG